MSYISLSAFLWFYYICNSSDGTLTLRFCNRLSVFSSQHFCTCINISYFLSLNDYVIPVITFSWYFSLFMTSLSNIHPTMHLTAVPFIRGNILNPNPVKFPSNLSLNSIYFYVSYFIISSMYFQYFFTCCSSIETIFSVTLFEIGCTAVSFRNCMYLSAESLSPSLSL